MIYIYNTVADTYKDLYRQAFESLEEYMGPEVEDTTVYKIMFFASLQDIFDQAKKRSAFRGRFAKDAQGGPLLEGLAITDDEQSMLEDLLPNGATEVFRKLAAWCKEENEAYQFNISFGAKAPAGTITYGLGTSITDSVSPFTPDALVGFRLVILDIASEMNNEERDILSNTADTLVIERAFTADASGLAYGVYNPDEKFVTYSLQLDLNWDFNMLQVAEAAIKEALVTFELKEWYLANRYMDDFVIEEARYEKELTKIRSALLQGRIPFRRRADFFSNI